MFYTSLQNKLAYAACFLISGQKRKCDANKRMRVIRSVTNRSANIGIVAPSFKLMATIFLILLAFLSFGVEAWSLLSKSAILQ